MLWQTLTDNIKTTEYAGWYIARRTLLKETYQYYAHKDEVFISTTSFPYLKGRMKAKQVDLLTIINQMQ